MVTIHDFCPSIVRGILALVTRESAARSESEAAEILAKQSRVFEYMRSGGTPIRL